MLDRSGPAVLLAGLPLQHALQQLDVADTQLQDLALAQLLKPRIRDTG